jgi:uncharacterized membrane protein
LAGLGNDALWYDEMFSGQMARLPIAQLLQATAGDVHPPLWYLIEWLSVRLAGNSAAGLRLPSVVLGTYLIYEVYALIKHLAGNGPARASALVISLLPAALNYAQEARMYSLLAVGVFACLRAVLSGKWVRAGLLAAVAMWTHNLAVLYMLPIGLIALWKSPRRALEMAMLAIIGYAPWGVVALNQLRAVGSSYWPMPPTPGGLVEALMYDTLYIRLPGLLVLPGIIGGVVLTAGTLFVLRGNLKRLIPILLLIVLPPLALYGVSVTWRSIWVQRTLLPSGILLASLWGIAFTKLGGRDKLAALALAGPLFGVTLGSYYFWHNPNDYDWRPSVQTIMERWQSCDVIYHINASSYMIMDEYAPGRNVLAPLTADLSQGLSDQTKDAMGMPRAPFGELAKHYCRAWLIDARTPNFDPRQYAVSDGIRAAYPVLATYPTIRGKLAELTIYLIDLRR